MSCHVPWWEIIDLFVSSQVSLCLPFNVDLSSDLSPPSLAGWGWWEVRLCADWLVGSVVIVYCRLRALVVTGPVPVCKIETFLALIVMLIVSLATLTTGVQEESSSARGKWKTPTGLWWQWLPPPPTTTGYRLTTGPGDLQCGWLWLVFVTAPRLITISHHLYSSALTTSYRSQLVLKKILEHPLPLPPLTHLS